MGGFVLLHTVAGEDRSTAEAAALAVFARMGMPAPRLLRGENYLLALYPKRQASEPALEQFPNGDFACACGTLIYDAVLGTPAAAGFYRDYSRRSAPRDRAIGHYAVIMRKDGETAIIPDGFGAYLIFYDAAQRIASSSFLAVASALDRVTLGAQGACEYVFNGVVSGDATVFDEVLLAPVNATITVGERRLEIRRDPLHTPRTVSTAPFEATVERSMQILDQYFSTVVASFGDRVTCALSGGYDSRFILALLRRHGINPRVYVYGPPGDKDVCLARDIAEGEGFALEIVDKDRQLTFTPDEFGAVAYENFLASDGYTWSGIFTNGAERDQRASRVSGNALALNGGGGEIWRNFFYLPDRSYSPREILWSFYSTYGYVALPFLEPRVTEHASVIPIGWKNHGAYEAELIRRADPRLAAYPSGYGHDFSGPPPLLRRLVDYGTYLRPPWLRRFVYRVKNRVLRPSELPDYLSSEYCDAVLPGGVRIMSDLFRLDRIADPAQTARILTLEYLIRQFDGRIHIDFDHKSLAGQRKCAA